MERLPYSRSLHSVDSLGRVCREVELKPLNTVIRPKHFSYSSCLNTIEILISKRFKQLGLIPSSLNPSVFNRRSLGVEKIER